MRNEKCKICGSGNLNKTGNTVLQDFFKCGECGVMFNAFRGSGRYDGTEDGNEKYSSVAEDIRIFQKKLFRWRFNSILSQLPIGKLLDIGCSTGCFIEVGKEFGWETAGIDVSEEACAVAGKIDGARVSCGILEESKFGDGEFSLINMSHLLEHIGEPHVFMKEVNRVLSPQGAVLIEVPNERFFLARVLIYSILGRVFKGLTYKPDENHIFYYTPASLRILIESSGFKVISLKVEGFSRPGRYEMTTRGMGKSAQIFLKALSLIKADELIGMGHYIVALAVKG